MKNQIINFNWSFRILIICRIFVLLIRWAYHMQSIQLIFQFSKLHRQQFYFSNQQRSKNNVSLSTLSILANARYMYLYLFLLNFPSLMEFFNFFISIHFAHYSAKKHFKVNNKSKKIFYKNKEINSNKNRTVCVKKKNVNYWRCKSTKRN